MHADEQLQVVGDWRAFRARLIAQEPASTSGQRISESNQRLLEMQNSSLAAEGCWCHPVAQIERGGILLSTPDTPSILGDDMLEQVRNAVCGNAWFINASGCSC